MYICTCSLRSTHKQDSFSSDNTDWLAGLSSRRGFRWLAGGDAELLVRGQKVIAEGGFLWKHFRTPPPPTCRTGLWSSLGTGDQSLLRNPKIQHSALADSGRGLIGCCGNHSDGSGRTRSRVAAAFGTLLSLEIFCSFLSTPTHLELRIIQPLIDLAVLLYQVCSSSYGRFGTFPLGTPKTPHFQIEPQKKSSEFLGRVDRTDRIIDGG